MKEYNIIQIENLKVGDKIIGNHVNKITRVTKIVAGYITKIIKFEKTTEYCVKGNILHRSNCELMNFSGILKENEIEVIDNVICNKIIELYDLANEQLIKNLQDYHYTLEKINELRMQSRLNLNTYKMNI